MLLQARVVCALAALMAMTGTAAAQTAEPPAPPPDEPVRRPLWLHLLLAEQVAILAPPTIYYYSTTDLQREDFELQWDWASWKTKLTSFDAVAFDTGNWTSNAFRHPLAGALHYQAARANGLGPITSTLIDFGTSVLWEYVVEYRERVSLNDIVVNTVSGFQIGEPLFQLGRVADQPGASWPRKALGWITSPIHRVHSAFGYGSWKAPPPSWTRIEASLGAGVSDHGDGGALDIRARGEMEVVSDPRYGAPGQGTMPMRPATWNRVSTEIRFDVDGRFFNRFNTFTIYGGRYHRDIGPDGVGKDWSITAGTGFDYETRPLVGTELDRSALFHLIGPRFTMGRWNGPDRHLIWEVAGYGDVGMVQAQVFGPIPPFTPLPQTSVLRVRGYYFASGGSVMSKLSYTTPRWRARVEGRASRMWSIDGYDRQELNGAPNDPENVGDVRLWGKALVGIDLPGGELGRVEAAFESSMRRGTWMERHRQTTETDVGVAYVLDL
jgi:hypothetical protein